MHVQGIFLAEHGVYPEVLPNLREFMVDEGWAGDVIDKDYHAFQLQQRQAARAVYDLPGVILPPPSDQHPVVAFREALGRDGLSRMAFCKTFCVHSAEMYNLEHGLKHILSEQFKEAMLQAGLPGTVLEELEFRCGEYARGEYNTREAV